MTNIAHILTAQLDAVSLRHLRSIAEVAESHGIRAYVVGGAVRDALLSVPVGDIDITVVGLTSEFVRDAACALDGEITARSQFNTFALSASGRRIDLAMARHETYTHPGALPTVAPGAVRQDLARRDFAINAMAASITGSSFGDLLDPFGGEADLKLRQVRVLHENSFKDDATRILRAARYAARLGFTLESETECLLRRQAPYLDTISAARLRDELSRVLQEGRAVEILELLRCLGVLRAIHPALKLNPHTLAALRRAQGTDYADKAALLLSVLTYGLDAGERRAFTRRLGIDARWAKIVQDTALARSRVQDEPSIAEMSRSEIYMRLKALDESAILGCALSEGALSAGDINAAQSLILFLDQLRHIKPILNGAELLALGVPQGPRIGELLNHLLIARLDQTIKTRQDEITFIQARL